MRIALATCADLPDSEVDDQPLHRAFERVGAFLHQPVWDDPAVNWAAFDAVLIRTTWDYHLKRDLFVTWAERVGGQTLLLNPPSVIRWNTHKSYLRELERLGLATVDTLWLEPGDSVDIKAECESRGWTRGFIKPQVGATARETLRFDVSPEGLGDAARHIARLLPHEGLMVQPYLVSVETHGEVSALFVDGRHTHGVRKMPVPGDYRVQDDHGASDAPYEFSAEELTPLTEFLASWGEDLVYARFDMLRHPDGSLRLIELELVEPSLFFRHGPGAAEALAAAVIRRVEERAAGGADPGALTEAGAEARPAGAD
jgi:hypothetical protein